MAAPSRIRKVTGRHICTAAVRVASWSTHTKQRRFAKAKRKGHDPLVCGNRAVYEIDGQPLCASHAGQKAIKILQGDAQ